MTEKESGIIEEARDDYARCVNILWKSLLNKHDIEEEKFSELIQKYATDETHKSVNEWLDGIDNIRSRIEEKYKVYIYHDDDNIEVEKR